MENGEVMTALELAVNMGAITHSEVTHRLRDHNNAKLSEPHGYGEGNNNVMIGLQGNEEH
jgi:hypothetical protein